MAHKESEKVTKIGAEMKTLFGSPILSSENSDHFDQVLASLMACFMPADFMEQTLIWELTVSTWDAARLTRHKTSAIERKFRQRLEFQVKRSKTMAEQKAAIARELGVANRKSCNELERIDALEEIVDNAVEDVDRILDRAATEREHAFALEQTVDYYERLDNRLGIALRRRNEALELFEIYREGLGQQLRKVSDQIIEVECCEVEVPEGQVAAPTVAPSDPGTP
jgi:hypothetical protein